MTLMWWLSSKLLLNKHFGHIAGTLACLAMSAVQCEFTSLQGKVCLVFRFKLGIKAVSLKVDLKTLGDF